MKVKILTFLAVVLSGIATLSAQTIVKGTVTDEAKMPLPGVSVVIKGTTKGTATDFDGKYELHAKKGDVLVFSFIGFASQEKTVGGGNSLIINVLLKEESEQLGEVVVTALGVNKQARSVGYATTKVATAEIERLNVVNPVSALQGKVAGMAINTTGSSGVTSSAGITIRGAKSLDKNNSPIFVVDGMILQESLTGALDGTDWGSQLKNLNPADYESITVLKGAAATALYGSRGANGAVVIVSKGGKFGKQGLGVEYSQNIEFANVYRSPLNLQNEYGAGSPLNGFEGGFLADGSLEQTASNFGLRMEGQLVNQYLPGDGTPTPFVAHSDNWKALYQSPFNTSYNIAINGGGENSSFRVSYSYMDNNGAFKRNNFNRNTLAFKGLMKLNNIFSLEAGVNYAFSTAQNGANQGGWNWGGNISMMSTYFTPRNLDIDTFQKTYRDPITQAVDTYSIFDELSSYLHSRDLNLSERKENSLLSNLKLKADIAPWLTASIKGNYNYYGISTLSKTYGTGANYGPTKTGSYGRGGSVSGSYNLLGMLQSNNNKFTIAGQEITLDAIVAAELYGNLESHSWSKATKGGLVIPGLFAFSNSAETIIPSFSYSPSNNKVFGLSGIINLGWKEQLFLEITGRNDWLSSLTYPTYMIGGSNNYSVFYPSVNASYVFTESFKMPEWFSFGKIRASIAEVGMGTSAYATSKGYGVFTQSSQYDAWRNSVLIARPNLGTSWNNDLKPEIQRSVEVGADLRFFNDRLNFDFAYYKTNTRNQILSVGATLESGASTQLINAGNIQNQGIELQVEGTPIRTKDFRWTLGANITKNKGKIIELHPNVKEWNIFGQYDGGPEIWAYEGGDYGVITTGYNNAAGAAIYRFNNENDASDPRNGLPVIRYLGAGGTPNRAYVYRYVKNTDKGIKDRVVLGKVEADFYLSLNTSFSYKNFDFYALADGRFGGQFYSNASRYAMGNGATESTLYGRSAQHGGYERVNYAGQKVNDAIMLDAVFDANATAPLASDPTQRIDVAGLTYREALEKGIMPMMATAYYAYNYYWGAPAELNIQENTWLMLREISVGYRFTDEICKKLGANYLRVGLTARNIGLLYSKLQDGLNPESISSNNPLTPVVIGGVPYSRTYAFNLTVRF